MSNKDLATNEHLRERGYLVRLEHPEVGQRTHVGIPWTLGGKPCRIASPGPVRGADTDAVLSKLLGYSAEKNDQLRKAGAELNIGTVRIHSRIRLDLVPER